MDISIIVLLFFIIVLLIISINQNIFLKTVIEEVDYNVELLNLNLNDVYELNKTENIKNR